MKPKQPNPGGLPHGSGSLQIRGLKWWAIYMNVEGVKIQESTKTDDVDEARRFLLRRALETARARVAALEAYEEAPAKPARTKRKDSGSRAGAGSGAGRSRSRALPAKGSRAARKGGSRK